MLGLCIRLSNKSLEEERNFPPASVKRAREKERGHSVQSLSGKIKTKSALFLFIIREESSAPPGPQKGFPSPECEHPEDRLRVTG